MFSKLSLVFSLLIFVSCSQFDLSSLNQTQVKKLLETPAYKAIGIGLGLCDTKRRFLMMGENYYFDALDSLGINIGKDSLYYYEFLSKYYDGINATIKNITINLKANGKELNTLADYSPRDILRIINFEGDTELFDEKITDYSLILDYSILIEGYLNNKKESIMKENQIYHIVCKDNKIISANLVYK